MTRDDLARFAALRVDFESIGLMEPGEEQEPYFCTPVGAEHVGRPGVDGIHFVLLPGDERVFCVDPSMGEIGSYVLPVGRDLREFLSFLLYCKDSNPISQIWWMEQERFRDLLREEEQRSREGSEDFYARRDRALAAIAREFGLSAKDPYGPVRTMQRSFDPRVLRFSPEYYDVLGLEEDN